MIASDGEPSAPLLDVEALGVGIATDQGVLAAVDALSLSIAHGQTLALVGESGCGKSLTAAALMRLLPDAAIVTQGHVILGDDDLLRIPEHRMRGIRGRRIGMIFQDPATALNPVLRIGTQIVEAIEAHTGLRGAAARARALEWLARVGIPDPARRFDDHPHRFSGGQQQRVMIAIALAAEPALLIADEPTSALDTVVQAHILDLLRTLRRERHLALLLITHDLGVVSALADRVALMYAGQIVEVAPAADFFAGPRHPYGRALLRSMPDADRARTELASIPGEVPALSARSVGCRFAPRCAQVAELCTTSAPRFVRVARTEVRCVFGDQTLPVSTLHLPADSAPDWLQAPGLHSARRVAALRPLLEVHDLRVTYRAASGFRLRSAPDAPRAVDGVSVSLHVGETMALVGESGCGKTTVGKAIAQLLRRDAHVEGRVLFDGVDLMALRGEALRRVRRDVQIVFQDPAASLDPRLCAADTLDEAMRALRPDWNAAARRLRTLALMAQVGLLPEVLDRHPHALSGGQRQRLSIARALCVEPRLIICDEPTSALDMSVQAQVLNLLRQLQHDLGLTCLVITHDFAVVRQLARNVAVMNEGRIACRGTVDQVFTPPRPAIVERSWRALALARHTMFDARSGAATPDL